MSQIKSSTYCPIPWLFQATRNNGDIRICCQANVSENKGIVRDENQKPYNAKFGNLDKARNAPLMKKVRKNMMEGRWSDECIRCQEEEDAGLNSRRNYEMNNWSVRLSDLEKYTEKDGTIDTKKAPIRYYDLRFGNKCNLACRMCGPMDSDLWYKDWVQMREQSFYYDSHGKVELEQKGNNWFDKNKSYQWYEDNKFWESLEEFKETLQHIYMAGGEPLLIKEHYKFLERCVESKVSQNIILEYNTNMTVLPDRVLQLWKSFKEVRVGASIDGFGDVLEFQRHPAKWGEIYTNLKKLDRLKYPIVSWMACTVTVYNVMHVPEFMRWKVEESGFKNINNTKKRPVITYHMAHKPEHLNVCVLTEAQKKEVQRHYDEYRKYFRSNFSSILADASIDVLDSIEKYMMSKSYTDSFYPTLQEYNERLDKIRGQDSSKFLPLGLCNMNSPVRSDLI